MPMNPLGLGNKNNCAGEDQQQIKWSTRWIWILIFRSTDMWQPVVPFILMLEGVGSSKTLVPESMVEILVIQEGADFVSRRSLARHLRNSYFWPPGKLIAHPWSRHHHEAVELRSSLRIPASVGAGSERVPLDQNLQGDSFTGTRTGEVPLRMTQASRVPTLQAWLGGFQELGTALLRDSKPSLCNPWKKQHKC
jgi:hypothetical protein